VRPRVTEAVLNHASGVVSSVAGICKRHAYTGEAAAFAAWAGFLDALVHEREP
jgi:hypothetical protein